MSTRASLIYILIGALLVGYVGLHWVLARDLDVVVARKWTGETAGKWGRRGTAHFVETDKGTFGFFGTPFTAESDEMFGLLSEGQPARVTAFAWIHGPLLAEIMGGTSRPNIVEVHR